MIQGNTQEFSLEFEKVSKTFYQDKKPNSVVQNISFSVKKGEFFSILGPSGCGKTTCLRMISGLETPTSGIVRMAGKVVNHVHPHKRNVHTVFQKYALFPHLNVFENVAFGLRMKKVDSKTVKQKVNRMLEMVKLSAHSTRLITQLSGGEQQRVALIRALVNEPEILLLDEPLAALDLKLREQMQQELSALQKQLGTTFIFVTHDQSEALTLSDRVAIMNHGILEQVGTPTEVYEQPASSFVAKFVGSTNVFKGRANLDNAGHIGVDSTGFGVLYCRSDRTFFKNNQEGESLASRELSLMVRPEKIRLRVTAPANNGATTVENIDGNNPVPKAPLSKLNVLKGVLTEKIYLGPTTHIKLQVTPESSPLVISIANQTATKMPALKIGEKYFAVWDSSDSAVFLE